MAGSHREGILKFKREREMKGLRFSYEGSSIYISLYPNYEGLVIEQ